MSLIKQFKEISKKNITIAGGKGASLGEMARAKFPVPPGFLIVAQAYEQFLTSIKAKIAAILKDIDIEDTEKLDNVAKEIQELIIKQKFSDELKNEILAAYKNLGESFVAVRSSATAEDLPTASFAGQQATFLNIRGDNNLIEAVQKCWASLFTARAIYYRQTKGFDHLETLIAVVVQEMVNADAAGVAFSVNPVNSNEQDIMIEASFGLGEAVVSGQVTPDLYIVHKDKLIIHEKTINEQEWGYYRDEKTGETVKKNVPNPKAQVIPDDQILRIAALAKKIEKHYCCAQDIEWAIENGKIYLLQARPITTLS
jgi:pyruvate, water dikinase